MTQLLIDRATLEQMIASLEDSIACVRHEYETDWRHGLPTRRSRLDGTKGLLDQHESAITAGRAALANAEQKVPDAQLCKFYQLSTYPELVEVMEKHITKLQARTPPMTGEAFTQKLRFA